MIRHLILTELKYYWKDKRQKISLLLFLMPLYMLLNHSPSLEGFFYEVTLNDLIMYSLFILMGVFGLINSRILFLRKEKRVVLWNSLPVSKKQKYWVNYFIIMLYSLPALVSMSVYGIILTKLGASYSPFLYVNLFLLYMIAVGIMSIGITLKLRRRDGFHFFLMLAGILQFIYVFLYSNQDIIILLNGGGIALPLLLIAIGSIGFLINSQLDIGLINKHVKRGPQKVRYRRWRGAFALSIQEQLYLFPKSLLTLFIFLLVSVMLLIMMSIENGMEDGFVEQMALIILFFSYPVFIQVGLWFASKNTEGRNRFYALLPTTEKLKRKSNLISLLIAFSSLLPLNLLFVWMMVKNFPSPIPAFVFVGLFLFEIVIYLIPIWADSKLLRLAKDGVMMAGFFFVMFSTMYIEDPTMMDFPWIKFLMNPFWIISAILISILLLYQSASALARH